MSQRIRTGVWTAAAIAAVVGVGLSGKESAERTAPKVVIISLDGAQPALFEKYFRTGVLSTDKGVGRLRARGVRADQNVTATPSITAVSHIAIATGSTAAHNDISGNSIHPVAGTIGTTLSGFGAPIGGYQISPLGPAPFPTAEPLWVQLRNMGRKVVTATWPGGDGADIRIAGTLVQASSAGRTTDYTVPFGAFGGLSAQGFQLGAASFAPADGTLTSQLAAAGRQSFSPVQVTTAPVETVFCAPALTSTCGATNAFGRTLRYDIKVAALDTTNDGALNYDTLAFFDGTRSIPTGPFALPSTGAAFAKHGGTSANFFFEGSGNRVGTAFFVAALAPNLSSVRFARYAANFIPRNAPVVNVVDDVNEQVGFWGAQPDFRIPERLSAGFTSFSDAELEAIYKDQVATFVDYQTRVALRAIAANPGADLVMIYIEQPDGSGHQFMLTDRRQATNPSDPTSIGIPGSPAGATGQDAAKAARYAQYLAFAYKAANDAVERIVGAVGVDKHGEPQSDVFVVSDHGMAPFHTAVRLDTLLASAGINTALLGIRTTGPAANIYINLEGRESGGVVSPAAYTMLVDNIASVLRSARDPNAYYNPAAADLFSHVWTRSGGCGRPGFCTDEQIGQDSGDIVALMTEGYNFDGTQSPAVSRLGDALPVTSVYSVPNFYGAHGHDSELPSMSAILYAAGPHLKQGMKLPLVHNIDIAPTVMQILGVEPARTMDGEVIGKMLKKGKTD